MTTTVKNSLTGEVVDLGIPGVCSGFSFSDLSHSRVAIRGKVGTGKSTLVHSNPRCLVLDPEDGGSTVPDPRSFRFPDWKAIRSGGTPPPQAQDYRNVLMSLLAKQKNPAIDTVGIDTLDSLLEVFSQELRTKFKIEDIGDYGGGHGKGYSVIRNEIFGWIDRLHAAGYGIVVIAHDVTKTIRGANGGETSTQSLAISETFRNALMRRMEHVLRIVADSRMEMVGGKPVTTPIRKLVAEVTGKWKGEQAEDFKTRLPLPPSVELPDIGGWEHLSKVWDEAIESRKMRKEKV